jgi:protein-tyrosine phosphatase
MEGQVMTGITITGSYNARWSAGRAAGLARSAALDGVGPAGGAELAALGVNLVIDLREPGERTAPAHGRSVAAIPLYRLPDGPPQSGGLEPVYDFLLQERGTELTQAVAAIADADGAVLVHCTAGKDRTGLVVALTLAAAGHNDTTIVDDYALSGTAVRSRRAAHADAALRTLDLTADERAQSLRLHLDSPPEAMRHALATLAALGGAEAYLNRHGLGPARLRALRRNLGAVAHA